MNEIIIYQTPDNTTQIQVKFEEETVWLSQAQMIELFNSSKANVSEHLKNIFQSGELNRDSTVRKFRTVRKEGNRNVSRDIEHYDLDVIISLGYRVNTQRGILFRQWATQRLKDFLVKGYAINQKRLDELQQTVQLIQKSISLSQYITV
jgi:hypothetical protein